MGEKQSLKGKIQYGKSVIKYDLVKSKRRKTSQINVDQSGVVIRVPYSKQDSEIQNILQEKAQWIFKKQLEFKDKKKQQEKNLYKTLLPHFGENIPLQIKTQQKDDSVSYSKGKFVISLKGNYSKHKITKLYNQWILQKAEKYLVSRAKTLSSKTNLKPSGISVKSLKGRWGSATSKGIITLNSNLIKTPKKVIDYIIVHELCHLKVREHSRIFWNLVAKYDKDYFKKEKWLENNQVRIS
jgi:predicted metal-dependent hydrolase